MPSSLQVWIRIKPLELLEPLAALVPAPRTHLVRYSGILGDPSTLDLSPTAKGL
jgi:hypothetical protein